jgi:hypothetical protein
LCYRAFLARRIKLNMVAVADNCKVVDRRLESWMEEARTLLPELDSLLFYKIFLRLRPF